MPLLFLALLAGACTTTGERISSLSAQANLSPYQVETAKYTLFALVRNAPSEAELHVYFEGDGRPWVGGGYREADDPTPRRPLALHWLAQDEGGRLYLGRPCYFGHATDAGCSVHLWTSGRYSADVVDAMAEALAQWLGAHPARRITLIGHSGGGILALLVAERVKSVDRVIAVASPIDLDVWTRLHAYSPLGESINPARIHTWRPGVERVLVFGGRDRNVPAEVFAPLASSLPESQVVVAPEIDHTPFEDAGWKDFLDGLPR